MAVAVAVAEVEVCGGGVWFRGVWLFGVGGAVVLGWCLWV